MEFAVQNSLRTGNPIIDAVLAVLVASVIAGIMTFWNSTIKPFFQSIPDRLWPKKSGTFYNRTITFKKACSGKIGGNVSDEHAYTLQMAIINRIYKDGIYFRDVELLMQPDGVLQTTEWFDLVIKQLPATKQWHAVAPNVFLYIEKDEEDIKDGDSKVVGKQENTVFTLRSETREAVEDYIAEAWKMATMEPRKKVQEKANVKKRFFYDIALNHKAVFMEQLDTKTTDTRDIYYSMLDKKSVSIFNARKSELHSTKSFNSLFFPGKQELKSLLDDFINKTGKYAVEGCQHKLGFLLHGEPGTGKTSLVKALAAYLDRSIVNVDPKLLKNNAQLHRLLFNLEVNSSQHVSGVEKIEPSKVIYLFEEIDVVEVFNKRTPLDGVDFAAINSSDSSQSDDDEDKPAVPLTRKEKKEQVLARLERRKSKKAKYDALLKDMLGCGMTEMNLQGLLTALDGVLESPGRVVIMTTNHPEKLDPALLRPGRVDCNLYFTYMVPEDMCLLINHYFKHLNQETTTEHLQRLSDLSTKVTAAQIECLCVSKHCIEEVIQALENVKPEASS